MEFDCDALFKTINQLKILTFVDCSYGMATLDPLRDKSLHDLFIRADQEMYAFKRTEKRLTNVELL